MVVAEMSAMVGGGDDDGARGLIELLFLLVLLLSLFVVLSSPPGCFLLVCISMVVVGRSRCWGGRGGVGSEVETSCDRTLAVHPRVAAGLVRVSKPVLVVVTGGGAWIVHMPPLPHLPAVRSGLVTEARAVPCCRWALRPTVLQG